MFELNDITKARLILLKLLECTSEKGLSHTPRSQILSQEFIYLSKEKIKFNLVLRSLIKLKTNEKQTLEDFEIIYKELEGQFNRIQTSSIVILPHNNIIVSSSFRIAGQSIKIVGHQALKKIINYRTAISFINKSNPYHQKDIEIPKKFMVLSTNTDNVHKVWEKIQNIFAIIQGVYDYSLLKDMWIETFGFKPRTKFHHPEWILIQKKAGEFDIGTFKVYEKPRNNPTDIIKIGKLRKMLLFVGKKEMAGSTKGLIYDCLRLYAQAMESLHKNNCFLSLWQLIETATIAENAGGNTKEVIKRINIIVEENKQLDLTLDSIYIALGNKRNDIVHKGIDSSDETDVNILKMLSEYSIEWLLKHEKKLKTKTHISEYFRHRTRNQSDRKAIVETINYLSITK